MGMGASATNSAAMRQLGAITPALAANRAAGAVWIHDHDRCTLADHAATTGVREELIDTGDYTIEPGRGLTRVDEVISLVRKVERRFKARDQIEQLGVDRGNPFRERALELIERHACLQRRRRVDQISNGFRLNQVALAVQERAKRELARLCESCTRRNRAPQD